MKKYDFSVKIDFGTVVLTSKHNKSSSVCVDIIL